MHRRQVSLRAPQELEICWLSRNSRAILHHFLSNLFVQFLNKITHKLDEEIECWKCLEIIPLNQSAIEELQGKLKTPVRAYKKIRRARTIPISFCTSKEYFHKRPRREIVLRTCPIDGNPFRAQIGGKYRIPINGPFSFQLRISSISEDQVE